MKFKTGDKVIITCSIPQLQLYHPVGGVIEEITTSKDYPYLVRYGREVGMIMAFCESELEAIDHAQH